jgi:hypothetical protein
MSADPNTPTDPTLRTGGFAIQNAIYDGSNKGQLEIISHWRAYEGTRHVNQYDVPPYKPLMQRTHPCWFVNQKLGECQDALDPEMLLAGRCASCNLQRQALMKCLVKYRAAVRETQRKQAQQNDIVPTGTSVADQEGSWGAWIRNLF